MQRGCIAEDHQFGVERLLEAPFARLPQRDSAGNRKGFGLGLALGVLYAPCAGPVRAAIVGSAGLVRVAG